MPHAVGPHGAQRDIPPQRWPAMGRRPGGYRLLVQEMRSKISRDQIAAWICQKSCPEPCDMELKRSSTGRAQLALTFAVEQEARIAKRALCGSDLEAGAKETQTRWWRWEDGR